MSLEARGLAYGFRGRTLGHGIGLALPQGSVACLLGPNGSGKTTLLRTLLGLLAPRAGAVLLDGRPLDRWPARERARRLAYVPQAAESYFDYSVLEMVEMGRIAHQGLFASPARRDRELALAALERVGLAPLAARPIQRVSGGERQLALIARALATGAPSLVMDEPAASLDFGNQALVLDEIVRLRSAGATVLFSTHHPDHALRVADFAILLRDGGVLAHGPAAAVLDGEHLGALYGRPLAVVPVDTPAGPRRVCVDAAAAPGAASR